MFIHQLLASNAWFEKFSNPRRVLYPRPLQSLDKWKTRISHPNQSKHTNFTCKKFYDFIYLFERLRCKLKAKGLNKIYWSDFSSFFKYGHKRNGYVGPSNEEGYIVVSISATVVGPVDYITDQSCWTVFVRQEQPQQIINKNQRYRN